MRLYKKFQLNPKKLSLILLNYLKAQFLPDVKKNLCFLPGNPVTTMKLLKPGNNILR